MTFPAHRSSVRPGEQRANDPPKPNRDEVGAFAFDLDGVIDAYPGQMRTIMSALRAAAHKVYVLTGVSADEVTDADTDAKRGYLNALGVPEEAYDELIAVPKPHDENKALIIQKLGVGVLVDNSKANVKAADEHCCCLLVWNSREK